MTEDATPDFTEDLEKLKGKVEKMREECMGILERLGLQYLVEGS